MTLTATCEKCEYQLTHDGSYFPYLNTAPLWRLPKLWWVPGSFSACLKLQSYISEDFYSMKSEQNARKFVVLTIYDKLQWALKGCVRFQLQQNFLKIEPWLLTEAAHVNSPVWGNGKTLVKSIQHCLCTVWCYLVLILAELPQTGGLLAKGTRAEENVSGFRTIQSFSCIGAGQQMLAIRGNPSAVQVQVGGWPVPEGILTFIMFF